MTLQEPEPHPPAGPATTVGRRRQGGQRVGTKAAAPRPAPRADPGDPGIT